MLAAPLAGLTPAGLHAQTQTQTQTPPDPTGIELQPSPPSPSASPRGGAAGKKLPIILRARSVSGRPDIDAVAEGDAEFSRGDMLIRADRLSYDYADDLASARGNVRITRDGNVYSGPEAQLKVERFEGFFLKPTYYFSRTAAGGSAERIDFLDEQRAVASGATYTSCPADGSGDPAWLLSTDKVELDFATNEGTADNAVLRFYGVPILAAPRLTFPLTDERKSGWLPPSLNIDTKSGVQVSVPYYWNIAPSRDATLTPVVATRRGAGLDSEFRYLEPRYGGSLNLDLLPNDNLSGSSRYALGIRHDHELPGGAFAQLRLLRVSDDEYWKDFPRGLSSLTPRLLASDLRATRPLGADWTTYARIQRWQVLQTTDLASRIEAPYERVPQIGARYERRLGGGLRLDFETEFNRFENPADPVANPAEALLRPRFSGLRLHALGSISRPFVRPGWTVTPKLSFNAASYRLDRSVDKVFGGVFTQVSDSSSRVTPSASLDSAWVFERDTSWLGKAVRQTLEPRLLYVNTLYDRQFNLPNFDSAPKDFNFESIFTENEFSGVDRVSDGHQLTAGVTTRFIDPETGAEALRLGLVQRYQFRDQRVTLTADAQDSVPSSQRFSDLLLLGSTATLLPNWWLDASVQYRPEIERVVRSIVGARYSPGPYRTVSATYRMTRDLSEQVELGWQWPLYGRTPLEQAADGTGSGGGTGTSGSGSSSRSGSCSGSWYSVGRVNYSTRDRRVVDSIVGVEYDAGCWIGRIVAERLSTGRSEATTRLLLQLELVGLSRLGSNPLQVLKDNVPGYRLLRDDRAAPLLSQPTTTTSYD